MTCLALHTNAGRIRKFLGDLTAAKTDDEMQAIVRDAAGPTGLMEFMCFDQSALLRKELGQNAPRVIRMLVNRQPT